MKAQSNHLNPSRMIVQKIENIWNAAHAWPGYFQAMRALLAGFSPKSPQGSQRLEQLASFPGLCCQAAGGQAAWAEDLAAAWLIFYGAAYIMDAVEDGDPPAQEWEWLSPAMAVNAASGLYFSASLLLNNLRKVSALAEVADQVIIDFYQGFLKMCGGQHYDLSTDFPTLEDYWEIAGNKSGTFFAIASRSGAHLATRDPVRLQGFHDFGVQLGVLIQILDDIDEVQSAPSAARWDGLWKCIPVIYALSHASSQTRARLERLLRAGAPGREAGEELLDLIDETGAVTFLIEQFQDQRKKAVDALRQAEPVSGFEEKLLAFLPSIY